MTKAVREKKKGKFLKAIENQLEIKLGNFCKGGHIFLLENSEKIQGKKQEIFGKGGRNFIMETHSKKYGKE